MRDSQSGQVLRLTFQRHGAPVWLAHLDVMHAFERGLRRAGLALTYSQGYNPRPQLVFALPLGVGLHAENDVVDAYVEALPEDAAQLEMLSPYLPEGLTVSETRVLGLEDAKHLMADVAAAIYRIDARGIGEKVAELAARDSIVVKKFSKGRYRDLDIHPLWLGSMIETDQVRLLVKAGSHENLRPDLILDAAKLSDDVLDTTQITREALFLKPHGHALADGHTELLDPRFGLRITDLPEGIMWRSEAATYLAPHLVTGG